MSVENIQEFTNTLTKVIPQQVYDALLAEMERQSAILVREMQSVVPVDSGALRASIKSELVASSSRTVGKMRMVVLAGNGTTTIVQTKSGKQFQLARLIEFGTTKRRARPFFFPIWRAYKRRGRAGISRALRKALMNYTTVPAMSEAA